MSIRKVIVTVAPTGGFLSRSAHPHLPTQPEEIAEDVARCHAEGAAIAALHARRPDDEATCDGVVYTTINALVRERCDIIINNSSGGGFNGDMAFPAADGTWEVSWPARLAALDGDAEMLTLDAMSFCGSVEGREVYMKTPPSRGRELARAMRERGIKPEWEVFSPTHLLQEVATLVGEGHDDAPHLVNLVLGLDRVVQEALPFRSDLLRGLLALLPANAIPLVTVCGTFSPAALAECLVLGAHVRVGLEDTPFAADGMPERNVDLVRRTVALVRELGYEPATPDEARATLGLARRAVAA